MSYDWRPLPHRQGIIYAPLSDGNQPQVQQNLHQSSQRNFDYYSNNRINQHSAMPTQVSSSLSTRGGHSPPISMQPGSPTSSDQRGNEYLAAMSRLRMPPNTPADEGHLLSRPSARTDANFNKFVIPAQEDDQDNNSMFNFDDFSSACWSGSYVPDEERKAPPVYLNLQSKNLQNRNNAECRNQHYQWQSISMSEPARKLKSSGQGHQLSLQEDISKIVGQGRPSPMRNPKLGAQGQLLDDHQFEDNEYMPGMHEEYCQFSSFGQNFSECHSNFDRKSPRPTEIRNTKSMSPKKNWVLRYLSDVQNDPRTNRMLNLEDEDFSNGNLGQGHPSQGHPIRGHPIAVHQHQKDQGYSPNVYQNHQKIMARLDNLVRAGQQPSSRNVLSSTTQRKEFEIDNPRKWIKQTYEQEHPDTRNQSSNYYRTTDEQGCRISRSQSNQDIEQRSYHFGGHLAQDLFGQGHLEQQRSSKILPSGFNASRSPATMEQWGEPTVDGAEESGGGRLLGCRGQIDDNEPRFITLDRNPPNTCHQRTWPSQWSAPQPMSSTPYAPKEIHYSQEVKPPSYNGRGSFDDYITQFQCLARVKGWSSEEMGIKLMCALEGNAVAVLGTIPEDLQADFVTLKGALMSRFSPKLDQDINGALCHSRRKKRGETYMAFAQDLKKLVQMSYGNGWNPIQIEVLTREKFFNAIDDFQLKGMIWARKPTTVEEAALMADSLQRLQQNQGNFEGRLYGLSGQSQSRPQREKEVSDESKSDADDSKDNNKYENDRRSKVQCYYCHQFGHYARECQVRKKNSRSRIGNQERKD